MNVQQLQADKLSLINWISQLQDVSLISKLKNIQEDNFEIPQWQQDEVTERIKTTKSEKFYNKVVKWKKPDESHLIQGTSYHFGFEENFKRGAKRSALIS